MADASQERVVGWRLIASIDGEAWVAGQSPTYTGLRPIWEAIDHAADVEMQVLLEWTTKAHLCGGERTTVVQREWRPTGVIPPWARA